jgi:hypothetical protein
MPCRTHTIAEVVALRAEAAGIAPEPRGRYSHAGGCAAMTEISGMKQQLPPKWRPMQRRRYLRANALKVVPLVVTDEAARLLAEGWVGVLRLHSGTLTIETLTNV